MAGRLLKQKIYDDPYGLDAWDQRHVSRCFVTIVNSVQWVAMAGERPPACPPTAKEYTEAGLPWFDYYGGDAASVTGAKTLKALASVAQVMEQTGKGSMPDNETVDVSHAVWIHWLENGAGSASEYHVRRIRQLRDCWERNQMVIVQVCLGSKRFER